MKKPSNPKERNLLKGAIRRVFSRSTLRQEALDKHDIKHSDPERPRVTRWSWCGECGILEPRYKMQVDHIEPLIKVTESLEDMTWDEVINRLWCDLENLMPICQTCHKQKSKLENKERRLHKKGREKK